jgi:hypothetical protein
VAGWYIFRAYVCVIGPLCAPQRSQQCLPSRTDENAASANLTCPCWTTNITGVVTRNYASRGFAGCFSSGKRSTDGFAKIVAAGPFGIIWSRSYGLRAVFSYVDKASAEMERPQAGGYSSSAIDPKKTISLCAPPSAGTAREVFLSQSRDRNRPTPHRLWKA